MGYGAMSARESCLGRARCKSSRGIRHRRNPEPGGGASDSISAHRRDRYAGQARLQHYAPRTGKPSDSHPREGGKTDMPRVTYLHPNGESEELDVAVGMSLMQGATSHGVDGILAECGGNAMCATCHVYVDPD